MIVRNKLHYAYKKCSVFLLLLLTLNSFAVKASIAFASQTIKATVKLSVCGDLLAEGSEDCDNTDLNSNSCRSLGYFAGNLACDIACDYDVADCYGTAPVSTPTPTVYVLNTSEQSTSSDISNITSNGSVVQNRKTINGGNDLKSNNINPIVNNLDFNDSTRVVKQLVSFKKNDSLMERIIGIKIPDVEIENEDSAILSGLQMIRGFTSNVLGVNLQVSQLELRLRRSQPQVAGKTIELNEGSVLSSVFEKDQKINLATEQHNDEGEKTLSLKLAESIIAIDKNIIGFLKRLLIIASYLVFNFIS